MKTVFLVTILSTILLLSACSHQLIAYPSSEETNTSYVNNEPKNYEDVENTFLQTPFVQSTNNVWPEDIRNEESFLSHNENEVNGINTSYQVTVSSREETAEGWTIKYYNQEINFSQMTISLISFMADDRSEGAISLLVNLPSEWSLDLQEWIRKEGLHFSFLINGKKENAFSERKLSSLNNDSFIIGYSNCSIPIPTLLDAEIVIQPYIEEYEWLVSDEIEGGSHVIYQLNAGDVFTKKYAGTDYQLVKGIRLIKSKIHYLEPIHVQELKNKSEKCDDHQIRSISIVMNDWEYNESVGAYVDGAQNINERGIVFAREKDISAISFTIDEFHIWSNEVKLSFSLKLPNDWTDAECESFYLYSGFIAYLDNDKPNPDLGIYDQISKRPFGREVRKNFESVSKNGYGPDHVYWREADCRELRYTNWNSNLSVEQWKNVKRLTIVPYILCFDTVNGEPISKEGTLFYSSTLDKPNVIYLDELSTSIEIEESLFEDGF